MATKTAATTVDYSEEELALLKEFEGSPQEARPSTSVLPSFHRLMINLDSVDDKGARIDPGTWHIDGSDLYSDNIMIRYFASYGKFIKQVQQPGAGWKTVNETVFFKDGERPYDLKGGMACKEGDVSARYYGFLYGMVKFPGKDWLNMSLRLPAGKSFEFKKALDAVAGLKQRKPQEYAYKMTLVAKKGSIHPTLKVEPDLTANYSLKDFLPFVKELKDYIDKTNERIMSYHTKAREYSSQKDTADKVLTALPDDEIGF